MDGSRNRENIYAFSNLHGYVWTGPNVRLHIDGLGSEKSNQTEELAAHNTVKMYLSASLYRPVRN